MSDALKKVCNRCKRELPATTDFFHKQKCGKYGLLSLCKTCKSEYDDKTSKIRNKRYREKDLERKKKHNNNLNKQQKKAILKYQSLHRLIRKIKPKQQFCTICNQEEKLELASISHSYTKNIEDWMWLCRRCHILFDKIYKEVFLVG